MKHFYAVLLLITSLAFNLCAQIEVGTNNNVGIGISGDVNSKLSINAVGNTQWSCYINRPGTMWGGALYTKREMLSGTTAWGYSIYGYSTGGNGYSVGVKGKAQAITATSSGRAIGVWGEAGNCTSGYNYGVWGYLSGSNYGSGIYGSISGQYKITGKYAGFFYGDVNVEGNLLIKGSKMASDSTLKKRIRRLRGENVLSLMQINAYTYQYKTPLELDSTSTEGDTAVVELTPEMEDFYNQERIGIMAQDVEQFYPELVGRAADSTLTVDYLGLIPVLLEAIKEQQVVMEKLDRKILKLKRRVKALEDDTN